MINKKNLIKISIPFIEIGAVNAASSMQNLFFLLKFKKFFLESNGTNSFKEKRKIVVDLIFLLQICICHMDKPKSDAGFHFVSFKNKVVLLLNLLLAATEDVEEWDLILLRILELSDEISSFELLDLSNSCLNFSVEFTDVFL